MQQINADELNTDSNKADVILSMEEMIGSAVQRIGTLKDDIKAKRDNLNSALLADSSYADAESAIKEQQQIKKTAKERIMAVPSVSRMADELKALQADKKELNSSLSDYLLEYNRMTGATQLAFFGSEEYLIVKSAKVKKYSPKKKKKQ